MKNFSNDTYQHVVSVRHQGIVIVFGSRTVTDETTSQTTQVIDYRILDVQNYDPAVPIDENNWGDVKTLEFPEQYRPVGMSLLTVPQSAELAVQNTYFQVFTDTKYVFFFRQSVQNTLFVDRFVLDTVSFELHAAWETRYQRSEQKDVTTNPKDTLGYKNMDSDVFYEPTQELTMVNKLTEGRFSVNLTPSEIPGLEMWQVFAINSTTGKLDLFVIPRSEDGLFDVSGKTIDAATGLILPDRSLSIQMQPSSGNPVSLAFSQCPATLFYTKQEEAIDENGNPQKLRRGMRLMLACPVTYSNTHQVAILDFGIGKDGTLTKTANVLTIPAVNKPVLPNVGAMPVLLTDNNGLTLAGGLLNFVNTTEAISLLEGADGLVHLYFNSSVTEANMTNFQVVQFTTETARAQFSVDTNTGIKTIFVGRQAGTIMNGATVKVEAGSDENLAKVTLSYTPPAGQLISEVWEGVPRHLDTFLAVYSGTATDDVFDPVIQSGEQVFYNFNNTWKMYGIPAAQGYLRLISQLPANLIDSASTITVANGSDENHCTLTINTKTSGMTMTEVWNNLPRAYDRFLSVVNGNDAQYDYKNAAVTTPAYQIPAGSGYIWFISKTPQIQTGSIVIDVLSLTECKLTLSVVTGQKTIVETWDKMPLDPQTFIQILNGNTSSYDYSQAKSTDTEVDLEQGSALFKVIGANPTNQITSQMVSYAPTLQGGSNLIVAINEKASGNISNTVKETTQKVTANDPQVYQYRASALFTLALSKLVEDLSDITVQNTPAAGAPRTGDGLDSAWTPVDPGKALDFESSCVQCPTGKLDLTGDITMEAWVKPESIGYDGFSRIIRYKSDQTQYVLGLKELSSSNQYTFFAGTRENVVYANDLTLETRQWNHLSAAYHTGYSLVMDGNEYIYCEDSTTLDVTEALTLEAWVKVSDTTDRDKIILSKYGTEDRQQSYQLKISGNQVIFNMRTNQPTAQSGVYELITLQRPFTPSTEWAYLAVTVSRTLVVDPDTYLTDCTFTTKMFLNGIILGDTDTHTYSGTLQINSSDTALTMGSIPTDALIPPDPLEKSFQLATVRLWSRTLEDTEIWNNFDARDLCVSDDGLVSYWEINEGEGNYAYDTLKVNDGLISSTKLWKVTSLGGYWTLYANGQKAGTLHDNIANYCGYGSENAFYLGVLEYGSNLSNPFDGILDEVRIWGVTRTDEQVRDNMYCVMVGNEPGLKAYWDFNAGSGNVLKDMTGNGNNGTFVAEDMTLNVMSTKLSSNQIFQLSIIFADDVELTQSGWDFSEGSLNLKVQVGAKGTLQAEMNPNIGINVTQSDSGGSPETTKIMDGESMALWTNREVSLKIMPGDGTRFIELQGNSGWVTLAVPAWVNTPAPVGNEGPQVINYLGGLPNEYNTTITGQPAIVEYGDMQADTEGNLFGVMKRCYAYINDNKIRLVTGFKVGEMDLVYIGQVQTSPKLVGFIEGAPPVPSENLTINDPKTDDYVGNASLDLIEEDATYHKYATSRETGFDMSVDFKLGVFLDNKSEAGGIGFLQKVQGMEQKLGLHGVFEHSLGWLTEGSVGAGTVSTITKNMTLCGFWEQKKDYDQNGQPRYLNPEIGQRYLPNNMGYALVKSNTADMYALKLRTNGSLVAYQLTPNPEIPQDWNIIMFPLNPTYIKNGTLDGMVGLVADPDYPSAINGIRGSYFQPKEAYALKSQIDREQEEIKTYFTQYNAGGKGRGDDASLPGGDLLRDWTNKVSKRSLVNTYVWTAQGGLYAEEEQFVDIKSESTGGSYYFMGKAGAYTDLKLSVFSIGVFFEMDALFGGHIKTSAVSSSEYSDTFGLKVKVTGEGWINKWDPETKSYLSTDCPGKVDTYRFMSFYLAPKTDNFDVFFDKVVDDNWLQNSTSPNALALRSSKADINSVWRVLYRTTFVSRVPPEFQRTPVASAPEPVKKPANITANMWLIDLVQAQLGTTNPTPAEIGTAVDYVLDNQLKTISAWWSQFWTKAQQPDTPEYAALESIRFYTKTYLNNYYVTLK